MPYFVVIRAMERPATIRTGDSHRIDVRVLHELFATLAEAEDAARRQAKLEQEYPWTAVYVVEAPHWRRAQHLPDPNDGEYHRAHHAIHRAAMADPQGRVHVPDVRRSAFQPPKAPPGPPVPSALPPAAFYDPDVQRALDALARAGFETIVHGHTAYFDDQPQYAPTVAAIKRLREEARRLGGPPRGISEQQMADRLIRAPSDVRCVAQRYDMYERDGEYEIGDLSLIEFRTGESIEAFVNEIALRREDAVGTEPGTQGNVAQSTDLKKLFRFQKDRLLVMLRLWYPEDGQVESTLAALQPVLGPATRLL